MTDGRAEREGRAASGREPLRPGRHDVLDATRRDTPERGRGRRGPTVANGAEGGERPRETLGGMRHDGADGDAGRLPPDAGGG